MPIYEYRCPQCERAVTVTRPIAMRDAPQWCGRCPDTMTRVITAPSAINVQGGTHAGWLRRG